MQTSTRYSWWLAGLLAVSGLASYTAAQTADAGANRTGEQSAEFLAGLRERGYFDMAREYLERMRTSPLASKSFQEAVDYELGITLIDACKAERVATRKALLLDEAQKAFDRFIQERPAHADVAMARMQLANVLVERGKIFSEGAAKPGLADAQKQQQMGEARKLFEAAFKVFEAAEAKFSDEHKKFPKVIDQQKETAKYEAREKARQNLLAARLALGQVTEEIARTYLPGSAEAKKKFAEAAARFKDLFDKYSSWLAGLYAKMWEGRCYREMGEMKKAYECFESLLLQGDTAAPVREMKNKALVLLLETYLLPSEKKYPEAIARVEAWEKDAVGPEESSLDGLAIKYLGGQAAHELAKAAKPNDKSRNTYIATAKNWFRFVTRFNSPYEQQAQARLLEPLFGTAQRDEPKTFAAARDRGEEARQQLLAAQTQLQVAKSQGKKEDLEKLNQQIADASAEALKYYRLALQLAGSETPLDELNTIRYYLAFLYYSTGDMYRAAVVGEFLARRYPSSPGGKPGAQIAMVAYTKLLSALPPGSDNMFENRRLTEIAGLLSERWPNEPEAAEAILLLIRNAVVAHETDRAIEYLAKMPAESEKRGMAELMVGQALWGEYLSQSRLPDGERPPQEKLTALSAEAKKTLSDGIARMKTIVDAGGAITPSLATAVLSLAQMSIADGEADKALEWLDDPKMGVVTLVQAGHPAATRENFPVETYKAALRAYVATQQLDKAENAMNALEKLVSGGGEQGAKLTQIYISLGRELQEQIILLRDNREKADQLATLLKGFELFLDRIAAREKGNNFASLYWVAETFAGLGAGLDPGGQQLPPAAKKYYEKAVETYKMVLARCEKNDPAFGAPQGAEDSVSIRLAGAYRRLGEYDAALDLLAGVLAVRPMMINAQMEAAYTYQAWGDEKPKAFELAMLGGKKAKNKTTGQAQNLVWGWARLATTVMRDPRHMPLFYEARYNLALCRLKQALSLKGADRVNGLKQAEQDIIIIHKLYPEMGGEEWRPKYHKLLQQVQKLLGKPATGLPKSASPGSKSPGTQAEKDDKLATQRP
jgi:hypothetical protein